MSTKETINQAKRYEMEALVEALVTDGGWSRADVAKALGVKSSAVARYATGRSMGTNAQRETLRDLCFKHRLTVPPMSHWIQVALDVQGHGEIKALPSQEPTVAELIHGKDAAGQEAMWSQAKAQFEALVEESEETPDQESDEAKADARQTLRDLEARLDHVQERLGWNHVAPCSQTKNGKACTLQHQDERDQEGRPVFWYGTDCKIVQTFCPACLAYWHVAVARNCVIALLRVA